jgi:hypothetical protein
LPEEFDYAHFNAAHPSLVYPNYLDGDEHVILDNLTPDGELRFQLPRVAVAAAFLEDGRTVGFAPVFLDTLMIDVPSAKAHLTWRCVFPGEHPVDEVVAMAEVMQRGLP